MQPLIDRVGAALVLQVVLGYGRSVHRPSSLRLSLKPALGRVLTQRRGQVEQMHRPSWSVRLRPDKPADASAPPGT